MRCKNQSLFIAFILSLLLPAPGSADTLFVPSQYSTIQEAIDAAGSGDLVLVDAGTYMENIDFKGKWIIVQSSAGAGTTIIDGSQKGPVVKFSTGPGEDAVLDGFTLTNGAGFYHTGASRGGAVYSEGYVTATITNCIITENSANNGGGVYMFLASLDITNNIITNNDSDRGGGIYIENSEEAYIAGNLIHFNTALGGYYTGAGIYCGPNSNPTIIDNDISFNTADDGGGICCCYAQSAPIITNNTFNENYAINRGGTIYCHADAVPTIINNTSYKNYGDRCGGIYDHSGAILIINNILWNNTSSHYHAEYQGIGTLHYCDVKAGTGEAWFGIGCIDADPCLKSPLTGDFHLTEDSPCINAGDNLAPGLPETDFDGDPRIMNGRVDMGADEILIPLMADATEISAATGGSVNFALEAGLDHALRNYLMLGTTSGTSPGFVLPGGMKTLPINWDVFTDVVLLLLNTPVFMNFMGTLDANGMGNGQLNTGPLPPQAIGLLMDYAYALNSPWDFASNPVSIEIIQ
ncbi:MAG: right-handed parallel beta-helix repeat-containing protein [Planctomycetota bacterium]